MTARQARSRGRPAATVRQFRPDDAEAASAVMVAAFASFLPAPGRRQVLEGFAPERLRGTSTVGQQDAAAACYVAVADGQVVGYVRGSASPFGFGTLGVIGVRPESVHQGIGSLLLRKMVAFWRRRGMRKVSTSVSAHNHRALTFYLKHGFRPVGYQRDHYLVGMDEVLLDRFLT